MRSVRFAVALAFVVLAAAVATRPLARTEARGDEGLLISVECAKPLEKLREDLPKACAAQKFGVLGVHDLKAKMKEKGVEFAGECLVFEVCNPHKAKAVLEKNPEMSTVLPCRISAYKAADGKIRLATVRPTRLVGLFESPELKPVAEEVEKALEAILAEAARS